MEYYRFFLSKNSIELFLVLDFVKEFDICIDPCIKTHRQIRGKNRKEVGENKVYILV